MELERSLTELHQVFLDMAVPAPPHRPHPNTPTHHLPLLACLDPQ